MSCEHPKIAINLGKVNGKYHLRFARVSDGSIFDMEEKYGVDNLLLLPCGKCPSCKAAHQKEWSVRCSLESQYYKENCMVTLTYEERLRPRKLVKRDFQDFIKSLRNRGLHFRYFGCGEYTQAGYPHYHIILFGYWPKDAVFDYNSKAGYPVYRSKFISQVWNKGIISVSEMSPGTAAYVAGYVDKKLGQGEFCLMSKKPGIGERFFREHLFDLYEYDNVVGAFGVAKLPRYCDKIADYTWLDIDDIKEKRKKAANSNLVNVIMERGLDCKDKAVGFNARMMRNKLERKKRL